MRIILAFILMLFAAPAFAQDWSHYDNGRFGYGIDIPPGFDGRGESDNGDGQGFDYPGKSISLLVWGGNLLDGFETEIAARKGYAEDDAWHLTYESQSARWASFSGIKGFRILYQRMILLCDDTSYASFQLEYSVADAAMDPIINRLVSSLKVPDCK